MEIRRTCTGMLKTLRLRVFEAVTSVRSGQGKTKFGEQVYAYALLKINLTINQARGLRTQFRHGSKEEVVPVRQDRRRDLHGRSQFTDLSQSPSDEPILELLKDSVLYDGIDDEDERRSQPAPKRCDAVFEEDVSDRGDDP